MNRREWLKAVAWLGAGASAAACGDDRLGIYDPFDVNFDGSVIVVGAGAAGLGAGYLLNRYGVEFAILEASDRFGGRVLRGDGLADFPVDLGAEWIHHDPSILASLIDDRGVQGAIDVVVYAPETLHSWSNGRVRAHNFGRNYYHEYKFKDSTWYGFLERYFVPSVSDRIVYNAPVVAIDTTGPRVVVTTADGAQRTADRVIVTVPIKILQEELVTFIPELTAAKRDAINAVDIPEGLKVFVEFERPFYPDMLVDGPVSRASSYDKLYYNAAFRKDAERHLLALFWVAHAARPWTELGDDAIAVRVIDELDQRFGGAASRHYLQHRVQNWSAQPWTRGAYAVDFRGDADSVVRELRRPIDGRVHFAGEAINLEQLATVHGAMQSAYATVRDVLAG